MNVRFSVEARAQILEAKAYFLKQKRERAAEFVREVRRIGTLVAEFPELGVSRGRLRLALLQGIDSGEVTPIPIEEAMAQWRALLR